MKRLESEEIAGFVRDVLMDPRRRRPVVGITSQKSTGEFLVDGEYVETHVGKYADVVEIKTGQATWELAEALPDRLDAYGGAMRVWYPGVNNHSSPFDHPLFLLRTEDEAQQRVEQLRSYLANQGEPEPASPADGPSEVVRVTVLSVDKHVLVENEEGETAILKRADVPVHALAVCLQPGMEFDVLWPTEHDPETGPTHVSSRGQMPPAWDRIAEELEVGDTVTGRVARITEERHNALVEILPKTAGILFKAEVDSSYIDKIEDIVQVDQLVTVRILSLNPEERKASVSVKAVKADPEEPRELPSLIEGGLPFDWEEYLTRAGLSYTTSKSPRDQRIAELEDDLGKVRAGRDRQREVFLELRERFERLQHRLEQSDEALFEPFHEPKTFVRAVRVWYAGAVGEKNRFRLPLRRMRLGKGFLPAAAAIEGLDPRDLVAAVGQVACDLASELRKYSFEVEESEEAAPFTYKGGDNPIITLRGSIAPPEAEEEDDEAPEEQDFETVHFEELEVEFLEVEEEEDVEEDVEAGE